MKSLLIRLFINNWPRKLLALALSVITWFMVSHSMTVNKMITNVPVRVINVPLGKTIEGMQLDGTLNRRIALTITGQRDAINDASSKDIEVVIDAKDKPNEWIASIEKHNLISHNSRLDVHKHITKISESELIVRQCKLITERIPVTVTQPIGEVPKGYQYLDVYPYQLFLTVNGPEDDVKRLKARGLKLTFNLNDIPQEELDQIQGDQGDADEVSYFVPDSWKKISLPILSSVPIAIDDPLAKHLRIDFSRQDLLPIGFSIPITVFFPPKYSHTLNPETYTVATSEFISKKNGLKILNTPLYAKGVSRHFLETVQDMVQMVVIAAPKSERETLLWSAQFMYPHELENRYVAKVLAESNDIIYDLQPHLLEDYLRNRFRNYMNRFRLYNANHQKLSLKIELQAHAISVTPQPYP